MEGSKLYKKRCEWYNLNKNKSCSPGAAFTYAYTIILINLPAHFAAFFIFQVDADSSQLVPYFIACYKIFF